MSVFTFIKRKERRGIALPIYSGDKVFYWLNKPTGMVIGPFINSRFTQTWKKIIQSEQLQQKPAVLSVWKLTQTSC